MKNCHCNIQPVLDPGKHNFSHYVASRFRTYCFSPKSSQQPYSRGWKPADLCSLESHGIHQRPSESSVAITNIED